MPPPLPNFPSELKRIVIHSPFLHTQLPHMFPQVNYAYRTPCQQPSSTSGTATSHILTSPPPVSSMTLTRKALHPPYQQFHVLVPLFWRHSAGCKQRSPSLMTQPLTKPLSLPSPKFVTMSTVATCTSGRLKRLFELLASYNTEGCPVKMTKQQLL